jgi:predicted RecB family nuclease
MAWIKPSDVESLNQCARRVWYEHNLPPGMEAVERNPFDALVVSMGTAYEQTIRDRLATTAHMVTAQSAEHTRALMAEGTPVIYQGQLVNEQAQFIGYPDFLIRQPDGRYQAADAKLARRVDDEIAVQLGFYRRLLGNGLPALAYLGTGEIAEIGDEANPDVNTYVTEIRMVLAETEPPLVRYSESKCKACSFYSVCKPAFTEKEELTLIYGIDKRSVMGLERHGITTITQLANADAAAIPDIPYLKGHEKKQRAVLQAKAWKTGEMFKLKDITLPGGTWVHFDIETNPLTPHCEDHVYLWGFLKPGYGKDDFDYVWTDHHDDDRTGWEIFLAKVEEYRAKWPDVRLVHYSSYERTKIKEYAGRYGMENNSTIAWLLDEENGPLFDLQKPVKDCLVLPVAGYGLKAICKHENLVDFQWEDDESGSQWSVVQYVGFLNETNPVRKEDMKQSILTYNRDDVIATRRLEEWLKRL